jgi:hypothetical protein
MHERAPRRSAADRISIDSRGMIDQSSTSRVDRITTSLHPDLVSELVRVVEPAWFDAVCTKLELKTEITARAMRRTFNDLCRRAQIESVVTRSISGHATEQMKQLYETVNVEQKRQSLAKVTSLARFRDAFLHGSVGAPESAATSANEAASCLH